MDNVRIRPGAAGSLLFGLGKMVVEAKNGQLIQKVHLNSGEKIIDFCSYHGFLVILSSSGDQFTAGFFINGKKEREFALPKRDAKSTFVRLLSSSSRLFAIQKDSPSTTFYRSPVLWAVEADGKVEKMLEWPGQKIQDFFINESGNLFYSATEGREIHWTSQNPETGNSNSKSGMQMEAWQFLKLPIGVDEKGNGYGRSGLKIARFSNENQLVWQFGFRNIFQVNNEVFASQSDSGQIAIFSSSSGFSHPEITLQVPTNLSEQYGIRNWSLIGTSDNGSFLVEGFKTIHDRRHLLIFKKNGDFVGESDQGPEFLLKVRHKLESPQFWIVEAENKFLAPVLGPEGVSIFRIEVELGIGGQVQVNSTSEKQKTGKALLVLVLFSCPFFFLVGEKPLFFIILRSLSDRKSTRMATKPCFGIILMIFLIFLSSCENANTSSSISSKKSNSPPSARPLQPRIKIELHSFHPWGEHGLTYDYLPVYCPLPEISSQIPPPEARENLRIKSGNNDNIIYGTEYSVIIANKDSVLQKHSFSYPMSVVDFIKLDSSLAVLHYKGENQYISFFRGNVKEKEVELPFGSKYSPFSKLIQSSSQLFGLHQNSPAKIHHSSPTLYALNDQNTLKKVKEWPKQGINTFCINDSGDIFFSSNSEDQFYWNQRNIQTGEENSFSGLDIAARRFLRRPIGMDQRGNVYGYDGFEVGKVSSQNQLVWKVEVSNIFLHEGTLFTSLSQGNQISILDPETGHTTPLLSLEIPEEMSEGYDSLTWSLIHINEDNSFLVEGFSSIYEPRKWLIFREDGKFVSTAGRFWEPEVMLEIRHRLEPPKFWIVEAENKFLAPVLGPEGVSIFRIEVE